METHFWVVGLDADGLIESSQGFLELPDLQVTDSEVQKHFGRFFRRFRFVMPRQLHRKHLTPKALWTKIAKN